MTDYGRSAFLFTPCTKNVHDGSLSMLQCGCQAHPQWAVVSSHLPQVRRSEAWREFLDRSAISPYGGIFQEPVYVLGRLWRFPFQWEERRYEVRQG
jgi:hypothetical protein